MIHTFSFPTKIQFGFGASKNLPKSLLDAGVRKVLVVTDKGIVSQPFFEEICGNLRQASLQVGVFSDVSGNPVKGQVEAGVAAYRKANANGIGGIGGGAALDVAKAIGLLSSHSGDLFDYEDGKTGALPIENKIPFWVALPTTSGTGSEVGRSSVISDEKTHIKKIIFSPYLLAPLVLADPELTMKLPPPITAATGMDALTHCVEAFLARDYHPICDGIALEGLRLAAEHLEKAVCDPTNKEARAGMMLSSLMGAIAFQKGLGLTHSCAHALSTVVNMHHGLANGVMIDFALKRNGAAAKARFQRMAQTIGLKDSSAEGFLKWLTQLKKSIGIPANLREAKVDAKNLKPLTQFAFADSCHQNNPVPISESDFEKIFSEALG